MQRQRLPPNQHLRQSIGQLRAHAGVDALSCHLRESAQLLGLARGLAVLALCKATAVTVEAPGAAGQGNVLAGTVSRAPSAKGGEVALALEGGLQLVGFAAAGSGLKLRAAAQARVEPAAVVIALGA